MTAKVKITVCDGKGAKAVRVHDFGSGDDPVSVEDVQPGQTVERELRSDRQVTITEE